VHSWLFSFFTLVQMVLDKLVKGPKLVTLVIAAELRIELQWAVGYFPSF